MTPGADETSTEATLVEASPEDTPQPELSETDVATNEGMAHPPETEVEPETDPEPAPVFEKSAQTSSETAAPQVIRETTVVRKAGFFPMLIGGVLAAGIGYGYAQYDSNSWPFGPGSDDPFRAQTTASLEQQRAQLDDLTARLGNTETVVGAFDVSELTSAVAKLGSQLSDMQSEMSGLSDQIGRMEGRVVELEKRPMEAALSPEAVAAYQKEMDDLRADIDSQRTEIQNFAAEAVAAEQNSEVQAKLATSRAALAKLTTALENGEPFEDQIAALQGNSSVTLPPALSGVAVDGVATLGELLADYPDAARAALAAARSEAAPQEGTANHLLSFFRDQVGARSVTPREGADADAVLSRAEAALKSGDVAGSLAEVTTLSETAQAAMGDWIAKAESRVGAQGAAVTLTQELNQE